MRYLIALFFFTSTLLFGQEKKALFIVNPFAGSNKYKKIKPLIKKNLNRKTFSYEVVLTKRPGHAAALSQKAAKEKYDLVVAVGGDGTVNEVAKPLIGTNTALGIIPMGSGNGLARHLQIPMEINKAIELLNNPNAIWMDTVGINDDLFLNVAGCGFDAEISDAFSKLEHRGFASYVKTVLQNFPEYKPKEYRLLIDGKSFTTKAFLISFANSGQYGNNVFIAPWAEVDDGYLDITILKEFPSYVLPQLTLLLFNQKLDQSKYIERIRCRNVIMEGEDLHLHIDGEPYHSDESPIHIRIKPSSLKVYVPGKNS